jgi:Flp pilus assembly protein TadG
MKRALTMLQLGLSRLLRQKRGNVAMMWALSAAAMLGLVGVSIDFASANSTKQAIQNAADGAALVAERMADQPLSQRRIAAEQYFRASLTNVPNASQATILVEEMAGGGHRVTASMPAVTTLSRLVADRDWIVHVNAEADQEGSDLEVALILDTTGSMSGSRISDLRTAATDLVNIVIRDEQQPYFSKIALVPYANSVNMAGYASQVRGPITGPTSISAATWKNGATKTITGATRANPVVITSNGHGFSNGDYVRITNVSGMTQLNNKIFTVANKTTNTFQLSGVNGSSYSNYSSGGTIQKCFTSTCEVRVTSNSHGLSNNDYVYIVGVNGMTQINSAANTAWKISNVTSTTFTLNTSTGPSYTDYTSGGQAYCTVAGCEYYRFTSAAGSVRVLQISTCVSERAGANAFTDAAPSTTWLGRVYPSSSNPCTTSSSIVPLTSVKTDLTTKISAITASGSTAGHLGIAWGWYMLSPKFGYLWPSAGQPQAYGSPHLKKIAVLMTDGAFNTPYCNGVIAANAGAGSGSSSDHAACNAPNGDSFAQAAAICTAMKDAGITIYTVGFDVGDDQQAKDALASCASSSANAHLAADGPELRSVFRGIATAISQLRLSK